jgi:hypothetical protein
MDHPHVILYSPNDGSLQNSCNGATKTFDTKLDRYQWTNHIGFAVGETSRSTVVHTQKNTIRVVVVILAWLGLLDGAGEGNDRRS